MRTLRPMLVLGAMLAIAWPARAADRPRLVEVPRKTVLVELYTSQG